MRTFGIFARSSDPSQSPILITTSRSFRTAHAMSDMVTPRDLPGLSSLADSLGLYDIMDVYPMPIGVAYCVVVEDIFI